MEPRTARPGHPAPGSEEDTWERPVPRPDAGLQLLGEYQGSGFTEPRYLARRGDGQVVQLTRLLHLVAAAVDGERSTAEIAELVSRRSGRDVSAANVAYLVDRKLTPLGLTLPQEQEGTTAEAPRSDLLLVLKGHKVLIRPPRVNRLGRALAWLHRAPVVAAALLAAVAMDVWLFSVHGAVAPLLAVLDRPVLLLAVIGLTVASLVFHEFGHASACRYGGASPGCIGCGLYLIWPSLYTDVTDVYRIGRAGRIRTDLGGVYFNVLFMLGLCGCYLLTGQQFLLAAVYLGHFEILEQLTPALRLDGYYILGDLAGVPDLFGKVRPILLSAIPGRPVHPDVRALKRSARVTVTVWVLSMLPLVLGELAYALYNLPRIAATAAHSLDEQLSATASALHEVRPAAAAVGLVGCVMLLLPVAGAGYLAVRVGGRLLRALRRFGERGTRARLGLALSGVVALSALGAVWADDLSHRQPASPAPSLTSGPAAGLRSESPSGTWAASPTAPSARGLPAPAPPRSGRATGRGRSQIPAAGVRPAAGPAPSSAPGPVPTPEPGRTGDSGSSASPTPGTSPSASSRPSTSPVASASPSASPAPSADAEPTASPTNVPSPTSPASLSPTPGGTSS